MNILLTGFGPFPGVDENPSALIVQRIEQREHLPSNAIMFCETLPVEFDVAGDRIKALIQQHNLDGVISLGVAADSAAIRLERVALNLDDCEVADNAGLVARARVIDPYGPTAYWSTLPLAKLELELRHHGIPVEISNFAGAYVCNHVFYLALRSLDLGQRRLPCGFIHVPRAREQADQSGLPGLPLDVMITAIEICITKLVS